MIPNFKISKEKQYRLDLVLDIINQHNLDGKLLDLGCKDGYILDKAKHLGYQVYGSDISCNAVQILSKQGFSMKKLDLNNHLSYPDNLFNIVTCLQVIEHLTNPEVLLTEIYRILKPGGILILSTPNLASIGSRLRLLYNKYKLKIRVIDNLEYARTWFDDKYLIQLFESEGFIISKTKKIDFINPLTCHRLYRLFTKKGLFRTNDFKDLNIFGKFIYLVSKYIFNSISARSSLIVCKKSG